MIEYGIALQAEPALFGFGKKKTYYEGFLSLSVAMSLSLKREFGANGDTISIAALLAAWLHRSSLNGGVNADQSDDLTAHVREGALSVFGQSDKVALIWSTCFERGATSVETPSETDRLFWQLRSELFPWQMDEPTYVEALAASQAVMTRALTEQYPIGAELGASAPKTGLLRRVAPRNDG